MRQAGTGSALQPPSAICCGQALRRKGYVLLWMGLLLGLWTSLALAQQAEVEYAKGVLEYSNRNYVDALEHLRQVVTITPQNADAQFYLGLTLTRLGDYESAIPALEKALQLDAGKQYVHYHLGLAYFQARRYQEAITQLQLAAQYDPQKAATQFYLGQSFYLLQRHTQAPPYFQRALELDPTLTSRAQYYQGLAFYGAEQDTQAQTAFQAVLRSAPGTDFASQAQRYLEAIEQRASTQRLLQVQGSLSFEYDDNVILEPNEIEISNQADGRAVINVVGRLTPLRTPQWRLGVDYTLFQSLHFDLTEFDIQSHTVGLFTQYKLNPVTLHTAVHYNYTFLDNTRFTESISVQPSAIIQESESLLTIVSVRYRNSNFFDRIPPPQDPEVRDRDGWAVRAGVHQYLLFNQQRGAIRGGYHYEANRTEGSDWEYDSHEISLGLQYYLGAKLTLNLEGSYTFYDYPRRNSFAADPPGVLDGSDRRGREDGRLIGAVQLSRPFGRYLTGTVSYFHTTNLSTLNFFDYHRNIVSLTLTGRY